VRLRANGLLARITGAAVHGPVAARFERHRRLRSARRARRIEHLARAAEPAAARGLLRLAGAAAIPAALRFVREAFFQVELLVANREIERVAAVLTNQNFVFQMLSAPAEGPRAPL